MTTGAKTKLHDDGVISICLHLATNDRLVLNEFKHLLWDCLGSFVARKTAIICYQKINSPSCVARKMAMICGQKINSPSCIARKTATICGQKIKLPSCVVWKAATICGQN